MCTGSFTPGAEAGPRLPIMPASRVLIAIIGALLTLTGPRIGRAGDLQLTDPGEATVQRVGRGDRDLDRRIDQLLEGDEYLLITSDTLIALNDTVRQSILVLDATLIVEGTIFGDLVEVAANIFLRPTAYLTGDLINIAGGLYPSALAVIGGSTIDRPLAPYRLHRTGEGWLIEGVALTGHLVLDGILGLHTPTYDRVDALGLRWGAAYLSSDEPDHQARIHGWVGYMSGRGALEGGVEAGRRRGRTLIALTAANETATQDRWIRGDLRNSISFLWDGDDYRNYYLTRRVSLRLEQDLGDTERGLRLSVHGQHEVDRSLRRVHTWTIVGGDEARVNPPIDEGAITGISARVGGWWIGRRIGWDGWGLLESAGTNLGGDLTFNRFTLLGRFGMDALADHALLISWYLQGPIFGTTRLPRQRWSILGGSGTLAAYPISEFYGDRVVFIESRYIIPLPEAWALPILGRPDLEIAYGIGNAWTDGMEGDLAQSLEARIRASIISIRLAVDPVHPSEHLRFSIGITDPFTDRFPWRNR